MTGGELRGGPVWHSSVAGRLEDRDLIRLALWALTGVGDAGAGQWIEWGETAVHVRRRCTDAEAAVVGGVKDIRGTPEALRRFEAMRPKMPRAAIDLALRELGVA